MTGSIAHGMRAALALALPLLVCACAGIAVPRLDAPLPQRWRHAEPAAGAMPVDLRGWWHAFHDPALDALVDEALRRNLQLGEAREHLQAARERYRSAGTVGLPRFGAKTEDAIDPDASASFFVAGFDASWELNLFGRGTALHRQARGALDAGVAEWQQARVSLVAEVVRDWLSLQAGRQQQAVLESELELKQRASAISQARVRLRLAAPVERDMAEMGVSEAKAALAGATAENEVLEGQLAMLLGRNEPLPDWSRPGTLPVLGMVGLDQVPADLLRTRPDIAAAEARVLTAAGEAGEARANLLPRLGIGGSVVWSTNLTTHRQTQDNALLTLGPMIDIPLFDWGARQADFRAGKHELAASVFAYRQAVLEGVADVEAALARLQQQAARQAEQGAAHAALVRALQAQDTRVRLGLAAPADRIQAQWAVSQSDLAGIDTTLARDLAFVGLYKALGGAPLPSTAADAEAVR